jgi:hypothetical protein
MSKNKIPEFLKHANQLKKNAIRYAASESVIFFRESFVNQGWTDGALTKWKKSSTPLAGKRTLYKSGKLMQSIRKLEATDQRLVVIADSDHAEIHNEGGYIIVTEQMKKFFWSKYCEAAGIKKNGSGKTEWNSWTNIKSSKDGTRSSLSKHNIAVSKKAMFFKRMALMKVGSKIAIPQRQFIGESRTLMQNLDAWFRSSVNTDFNKPTQEYSLKEVK